MRTYFVAAGAAVFTVISPALVAGQQATTPAPPAPAAKQGERLTIE